LINGQKWVQILATIYAIIKICPTKNLFRIFGKKYSSGILPKIRSE